MADMNLREQNGTKPMVMFLVASGVGLLLGGLAWAWLQYGEAIYLQGLAGFIATCF
ncbi:MAG: hypothetical protein WBO55_11385 [Rhizobiaceae bacterium]